MLYKNIKVHSLDGDTDSFDIVTGVLQGDTLAPYLFICLDYVLRTSIDLMKENSFNYSRILQAVLNKSWRQHSTKQQL